MNKELLNSINELHYSDEEMKQFEEEAHNQKMELDKYYVKNSSILRKLSIETWKQKIQQRLTEGEQIEKDIFADQRSYGTTELVPGGYTGGSAVYYYIVLTNKRFFVVGLDQFYREILQITKSLKQLTQLTNFSVYFKDKKVVKKHPYYEQYFNQEGGQIVFEDKSYIEVTSLESQQEMKEFMQLLIKKGVPEKPYYGDVVGGLSKGYIGWSIFIVILGILLLLKHF